MLSDALFNKFRSLIYEKTGINLSPEKKELLQARLGKRLRACSIASFKEYYKLVASNQEGPEFTHFVNSVSTNFTSFFREQAHFSFLEEIILPQFEEINSGNRNPIKVWSAACSSGEEPYTLAMVLEEYFLRNPGRGYRITATDISTKVLEQAKKGIYTADRLEKVPDSYLRKYFQKGVGRSAGYLRIKKEFFPNIQFLHFNLMEQFPWKSEIDVIFCRNVMIYFDRLTQQQMVNKFYDCLVPGGYLMIGHSESISSFRHSFRQKAATVFSK